MLRCEPRVIFVAGGRSRDTRLRSRRVHWAGGHKVLLCVRPAHRSAARGGVYHPRDLPSGRCCVILNAPRHEDFNPSSRQSIFPLAGHSSGNRKACKIKRAGVGTAEQTQWVNEVQKFEGPRSSAPFPAHVPEIILEFPYCPRIPLSSNFPCKRQVPRLTFARDRPWRRGAFSWRWSAAARPFGQAPPRPRFPGDVRHGSGDRFQTWMGQSVRSDRGSLRLRCRWATDRRYVGIPALLSPLSAPSFRQGFPAFTSSYA